MKENMYTYHYFQNRSLKRPYRLAGLIFYLVLLSSLAYMVAALYFKP